MQEKWYQVAQLQQAAVVWAGRIQLHRLSTMAQAGAAALLPYSHTVPPGKLLHAAYSRKQPSPVIKSYGKAKINN